MAKKKDTYSDEPAEVETHEVAPQPTGPIPAGSNEPGAQPPSVVGTAHERKEK